MTSISHNARRLRGGTALQALALLGSGLMGSAAFVAPAAAQNVTSSSLSGSVKDAEGSALQGASVTVVSADRGFTLTTTTSASGQFQLQQVPIGKYVVTIAKAGYKSTRTDNVQVSLGGSSYSFDLASAAGDGDVIVVTAQAKPTIDFSGTATGAVFNVMDIAARLPIGRNIEAIQLLAPQATLGDDAFNSTATGRSNVSLAGSSVAENIYYIDGMNVTNFRTFVGGTTVPFEFYDQVQVKTGGYQAEFGRNTGGAVIAVTRSGSNEFKGGMNIYYSPDGLREDSPDTYAAYNRLDKRDSIEGNLWASGPIIKDRLFFFAFFNPRDIYQSDTAQTETFNSAGASTGFTQTTRTERVRRTPFYGGKINLNLFEGQRLEATYFSDSQDALVKQTTLSDGSVATNAESSGGENYSIRYTGTFTDWLTVSALYGKSTFNQTSAGSDDANPYVLDGRTGVLVYVGGNPAGLIEKGRDRRENFRADVDLSFSLLGDHQVRFGGDYEKLNAVNQGVYSGGVYYRYYRAGAGGAVVRGVAVPPNTDYIRLRSYNSGGSFDSKNLAVYVQDSWDVTPRLNLNLGLRYDKFENLNASGGTFITLDKQFAPRLGFSYDVFGDKRTSITGFYGRYYLPVAANTNLRMAGNEFFYEEFYNIASAANLARPVLGSQIGTRNVLSDSNNPDARTLVSQNLKPQFLDEFILGLQHRFGSHWRASLTGSFRKLGAVLEDTDTRYSISSFCKTQSLAGCNATNAPTGSLTIAGAPAGTILPSVGGAVIGSGGYILVNPGSDAVIFADLTNSGTLTKLTIPAQYLGLPKARREYVAAEFKLDRDFVDGWGGSFSYVWADSRGNYEGGVKSDNGQDDTGLTQDFDEPGWTDGSYGYLPNHRRHTFKLYGSYEPIENLTIGFNGVLQSPRKFGCYGTYPLTDGRASLTTASSWYCSNPAVTKLATVGAPTAQDPSYTAGVLIGRGKVFESDWTKQIDLSFSYKIPMGALDGLTLRADVINVFNWSSRVDFNEAGDLDNRTQSNRNYGKVVSYQAPRSVRFGASLNF